METAKEFGVFTRDVLNSWAGYCTGGVIVALLWLWSTLNEVPISRKIGIAVAIFFLAVALFNAWQKQYRRANTAELPNLSARIDFLYGGNVTEINGAQLWMVVALKNEGAPSVAGGYRLGIEFEDRTILIAPTRINDGYELRGEGDKVLARFSSSNRLEDKTMSTTIQRGLPVRGWLRFDFPGIEDSKIRAAKKTLCFRDVNDKEYSISFTRFTPLSSPLYYPGSGDNPFEVS
jgi:hypothetical protein